MDDFNAAPEGLKEIDLLEWCNRGMFHYQKKPYENRQVTGDQPFDLLMWDIPNFEDKKLGFAIMRDWFDSTTKRNRPTTIIRFCRYGLDEDWEKFERRFAAQFARDNS